ncbi:MAG TPA: flagellar hook protein FlgE [Casimicrobiaceae bacterium]|nr:flagellar hook protein FlgE [Casimicrobiaceae bacterium]
MSFQQGLSGLFAASQNLDVIGNNVANANTVGFKSGGAIFADVYANSLAAGGQTGPGIGVAVASIQQNFLQGNVKTTSNPLDVAINGQGFFRLDTNGTITYSRNGQFHLDKDGFIVTATGSKVTGYGVDANGDIVVSNATPLQVDTTPLKANATTESAIGLNLDARDPVISTAFNATDAKTYNKATSMTVYDSQGNPHAFTTYYVKTAANTWSVHGAVDGTVIGSPLGTLNFNTDGTLNTSSTTLPFNVSAAIPTGPVTPLVFTLDYPGATQFGSDFAVSTLTQDGFTSGQLSGFAVGDDGTLVGRYTNGQTRNLGQVLLANFPNPNGLQPLGNNQWAETSESGQPVPGGPGTGSLGVLQSGAVEESNVDLTQELVDMITAQRVYQANAQTIKTQDQILNTLVNLR